MGLGEDRLDGLLAFEDYTQYLINGSQALLWHGHAFQKMFLSQVLTSDSADAIVSIVP